MVWQYVCNMFVIIWQYVLQYVGNSFAIFVFFTMKYVWPPIAEILEQRRDQIAKGLAAAEKSERDWELMQVRIQEEWDATKKQAAEALESARAVSVYGTTASSPRTGWKHKEITPCV